MRWKITGVIAVVCVLLLTVVLWPEASCTRTLPDGTTFVLSGLRIGQSNVYVHGSFLSRSIGRLAPANGVQILGVLPGSPRESVFLKPPFYRKLRLLISADDGFAFVQDFQGFSKQPDGIFAPIAANAFPRDARVLRIRMEDRDSASNRDWRELATFSLNNPRPARVETWPFTNSPRWMLPNGLQVEIGELVVRREPIHPSDIWQYLALLPIRITSKGEAITNWGIHNGTVKDASGNQDGFSFGKVVTNDWMIYRIFRPLDPAKVWRFKVGIALDSNFPATNLFSFEIPWPLKAPIQTNFGGVQAQIDFVNQDMLAVQLTNKPEGLRLAFVSASDPEGSNLDGFSGSWGQHSFWRMLKLAKTTTVHATIAIHTNYPVEFTLKPRFEKPPITSSEK
jgi:hypothetical protein